MTSFQDMLSGSPEGQLLRIKSCLLVTTLLFAGQYHIGARRSFSRVNYVATQIIYKSVPLAITSTLALMHYASTAHVLYPVWACALAYAYGGVSTMTVCSIGDNDNSVSYLLSALPLLTWTIYLAGIAVYIGTPLQVLLLVVTLASFATVAIVNIMDMLDAFHLSSRSKGLPGIVEPTDRYMRENYAHDEASADPVSMRGYGYPVWRNPAQPDDVINTEDVWRSVGTRFLSNCPGVERLKDTCLSYALFLLILRRFADYPLHEISRPKTRRFVREGLLINRRDPPSLDPKRVFRVIELELSFLYKFFYTKSPVYRSFSYRDGVGMIAQMLLIVVCRFGIPILAPVPAPAPAPDMECRGKGDKADITALLIVLYFLFWVSNIIQASSSDGSTVWSLCEGLSKVGTDDEGARSIEKLFGADHKDCFYRMGKLFGKKPWQRKLGQYSFLESYGEAPMLSRELFSPLARVAKLPRVGQAGDFTVPLSNQVKRTVVASLLPHVQEEARPLSRGTSTITRHQLWEHIPRAREYLESSDAHVILVWHIATFFCESQSPPNNTTDVDNFLVATHLSKYCAYLLTFAPELLPGQRYTTECFFDSAVEQAKTVYTQGSDVSRMYQNLTRVEGPPVAANDNVVVWGALLARALIDQVMLQDRHTVWGVLAKFWAELLLYLAPSDNVAAHGEYLARGGEFITHVWALLTHAGIVARN